MIRLFWLILVLCSLPSIVDAACTGSSPNLTAASPGRTDVNACFTAAATSGDTITVPAGSATWTTQLAWSGKSVSVIGAGIGQTIITAADPNNNGAGPCLLDWTTTNAGRSRLSGFTFLQTSACNNGDDRISIVRIGGVSHQFRLDHVRFETTRTGGQTVTDDVRGVTDHSEFVYPVGSPFGFHFTNVEHVGWNGLGGYGDQSWFAADSYGTADSYYFEDNLFDNQAGSNGLYCTNDSGGGRAVYRFNTWHECTFQTHGTESGGRRRGQRHTEHYRELFTWSIAAGQSCVICFRGGSGKIFDIRATTSGVGSLNQVGEMNTYRRGGRQAGDEFYPWGFAGQQTVTLTRSGTTATATASADTGVASGGSYVDIFGSVAPFNVTGVVATRVTTTQFTFPVANSGSTSSSGTMQSTFDGNTGATGYRAMDQAGAGQSILFSGDGPGSTPVSPLTPAGNTLSPFVFVHTLINGSNSNAAATAGSSVITANRDYYNYNAACTGAACATGVGMGTTLPTGCVTGTYFYKTDAGTWNTSTTDTYSDTPGADGVIYQCASTDVWAVNYTPYTYPHPSITLMTSRASGGIKFSGGIKLP